MAYILFSPIGGSDPIANNYDGSMLHICRFFHPAKIYLYLSKEMCDLGKDGRYQNAILKLAEKDNWPKPSIETKEKNDLTEVQVFDTFYQEFEQILTDIHKEAPRGDTILVNTSSGTPAMKSTLYFLARLLPFKIIPLQVSTPVKGRNPRLEDLKEYDLDEQWIGNNDNYADYSKITARKILRLISANDEIRKQARIVPVQYENLAVRMQLENIKTHIDHYDYGAALAIAKSRPADNQPPMNRYLTGESIEVLEDANKRIQLQWNAIRDNNKTGFGIEDRPVDRTNLSEYLLWLQMKQKRGDLADFLRGMTPALFNLMKIAVEECLGEPGYRLSTYCDGDSRLLYELVHEHIINGVNLTEILGLTPGPGRPPFLGSEHYEKILRWEGGGQFIQLLVLREIEKYVRNPMAHTITYVSDDWINGKLRELRTRNPDFDNYLTLLDVDNIQPLNSAFILGMFKRSVDAINAHGTLLNVNWTAYKNKMNPYIKENLTIRS